MIGFQSTCPKCGGPEADPCDAPSVARWLGFHRLQCRDCLHHYWKRNPEPLVVPEPPVEPLPIPAKRSSGVITATERLIALTAPTPSGAFPALPPLLGNRRSSPRLKPREGVIVICRETHRTFRPEWVAEVLDVSRGGLRLRLDHAIDSGQSVDLTIESTVSAFVLYRSATIAWCRPTGEGVFEAGIQFDEPISYSELAHYAVDPGPDEALAPQSWRDPAER